MTDLGDRHVLTSTEATGDVWIANGLRKPWRVCSHSTTYGEWDRLEDAIAFITLLVLGNSDLSRLA